MDSPCSNKLLLVLVNDSICKPVKGSVTHQGLILPDYTSTTDYLPALMIQVFVRRSTNENVFPMLISFKEKQKLRISINSPTILLLLFLL